MTIKCNFVYIAKDLAIFRFSKKYVMSDSFVALFPKDIVFDILDRLPKYSIQQCELVCTLWRKFFVQSGYARRKMQRHAHKFLSDKFSDQELALFRLDKKQCYRMLRNKCDGGCVIRPPAYGYGIRENQLRFCDICRGKYCQECIGYRYSSFLVGSTTYCKGCYKYQHCNV